MLDEMRASCGYCTFVLGHLFSSVVGDESLLFDVAGQLEFVHGVGICQRRRTVFTSATNRTI